MERPALRHLRIVQVAGISGMAGAITYSYLLLDLLLSSLDPRRAFVSEESARDQPWHQLFAAFDLTAGILIVVLGVGLLRARVPGGTFLAGTISLITFGASTIGVALLPLDCAPSASVACQLRENTGAVSWMHQGHTVVSVTASASVMLSLLLLGLSLRSRPRWRQAGRASLIVIGPVFALSAVLSAVGLGWGRSEGDGTPGGDARELLGVFERAEIMLVVGWLLILAWTLLRSPPRPGTGRSNPLP